MNFIQACNEMLKGKKVFRKNNSCDWFCKASLNFSRVVVCNLDDESKDMDQQIYFDDVRADDWIIIDEKAFKKGILKEVQQ